MPEDVRSVQTRGKHSLPVVLLHVCRPVTGPSVAAYTHGAASLRAQQSILRTCGSMYPAVLVRTKASIADSAEIDRGFKQAV